METALRAFLKASVQEYVTGMDNIDSLSGPMTFRNLSLKTTSLNAKLDEDYGPSPFSVTGGKIGMLSLKPSWLGSLQVALSGIELDLSFSPMKAASALANAMGGDEEDVDAVHEQHAPSQPRAPPRQPVPRYCSAHDASSKRTKAAEPTARECGKCGMSCQTTYADFSLCPPCSEKDERCMICGGKALPPPADAAAPPTRLVSAPPPPPQPTPMFCSAHNAGDKRQKGEPEMRECRGCQNKMRTTYSEFAYCPPCSEMRKKCVVCGEPGVPEPKPPAACKRGAEPQTFDTRELGARPPPPASGRNSDHRSREMPPPPGGRVAPAGAGARDARTAAGYNSQFAPGQHREQASQLAVAGSDGILGLLQSLVKGVHECAAAVNVNYDDNVNEYRTRPGPHVHIRHSPPTYATRLR